MNDLSASAKTGQILVEEVLPHAPKVVWSVLTDGDRVGLWLMQPTGFKAEVGTRFTFQTKPAGAWDGTIRCEVLEVVENERLSYAWRGGDDGNVGYGSLLDTIVTFTLTPVAGGTKLRLVHAGFELPRNESAITTMGEGWKKVVPRIGEVASTQG